jgi:hypothetical protein
VAEVQSGTEGQHECARQDWCTGYRLVPQDGGTSRRAPGLTYQAFCQADTALIAAQLDADRGLPAAWLRLQADIGDPARRGVMIRVPFGPRMVLSEYYDMLMRRITEVLCSHEERVRTAARLAEADTQESRRGDAYRPVRNAADALSVHLSVLLALPAGPVFRHIPSAELKAAGSERAAAAPILALWQDAIVFANRDGMATLLAALTGAHAGLEVLDLHRRCLSALGEVAAHPEILDGVPCRSCGTMGLERAEPPSDPKTEPDYSRCPSLSCGDRMKLDTYRAWVRRYEAWARSQEALTCQRCLRGDCGQCVYGGCECAANGHPGLE